MIAHEPRDQFGFMRLEAQSRTQLHSHFRTQYTMVAAAALGNVVEQCGDKENPPVLQFFHRRRAVRMFLGQIPPADLCQQADRADAVFVDRIMVIHVKLHLRHYAAEIRNEAPEYRRLVHPAQHQFGIAR